MKHQLAFSEEFIAWFEQDRVLHLKASYYGDPVELSSNEVSKIIEFLHQFLGTSCSAINHETSVPEKIILGNDQLYAWIEQEGSVHIKTKTPDHDGVSITENEAKKLLSLLCLFMDKYS